MDDIEIKMSENFNEHNSYLKRYAGSILKNTADAEDAVQETWIKVFKYIDSFDESKGASYKGWIGTICKRVCIDLIRKRQTRHYFSHLQYDPKLDYRHSKQTQAEDLLIYYETKKHVEKVLRKNKKHVKLLRGLLEGHTIASFSRKTGENRTSTGRHAQEMRRIISKENALSFLGR